MRRGIPLKGYIYYNYFITQTVSTVRSLIFPIYAYQLGYSPLLISSLFSTFLFLTIILYYPSVFIVKRINARNAVVLGTIIDSISIILLSINNVILYFLSFGILSLAQVLAIQMRTLITHNFEENELKNIYARAYTLAISGALFTTMLSSVLGYFRALGEIFLPLGIIYFGLSFFTLLFKPVSAETGNIKIIPSKSLLPIFIFAFFSGFVTYIVLGLLQIWYLKLGLSATFVSIVYLLMYLVNIISNSIVEKIKEESLIKNYIILSIISAILLSLISIRYYVISILMLLSSQVTNAIMTIINSVLFTKFIKRLNEAEVGSALTDMFTRAGAIVGIMSQGYFFTVGFLALPFIIGASISLIDRIIRYEYYRKYKII
ncbi:hypothetical protein SACC_24470 [Saccharolobus caldissimus]|uniref:MFS transporter n=1 Tax=Saccharolobus caldissimus TaxID=1702097 RepID=A0AAQ4CUE9_9CREN|nr:hypothetical protein SACC_24470 [Saccharolobus caldissimus]